MLPPKDQRKRAEQRQGQAKPRADAVANVPTTETTSAIMPDNPATNAATQSKSIRCPYRFHAPLRKPPSQPVRADLKTAQCNLA